MTHDSFLTLPLIDTHCYQPNANFMRIEKRTCVPYGLRLGYQLLKYQIDTSEFWIWSLFGENDFLMQLHCGKNTFSYIYIYLSKYFSSSVAKPVTLGINKKEIFHSEKISRSNSWRLSGSASHRSLICTTRSTVHATQHYRRLPFNRST